MPIYEYECKSCGHRLEILQKITEEALKKCPHCGKDSLSKLISATTFQLKGTGWYVTDFRDKGKAKPESDSASSSETTEKNVTKKDTKEPTKTDKTDTNKTAQEPKAKDLKTSQVSNNSKAE